MKGKAIMIQGTASHVGKSILVTALCRIFRQDGLRVAPFKAQNMSLNSYVTGDGQEIARAQAVQAEAAGVPPEAIMNPILLKPGAHSRSQVVVLGRPLGEAEASQYREHHVPVLAKVVEESIRQLLGRFDLVVIEGAGSPAEVNLRDRDPANMYVASLVDAPVLLVADIDRPGLRHLPPRHLPQRLPASGVREMVASPPGSSPVSAGDLRPFRPRDSTRISRDPGTRPTYTGRTI